jgi:glycosyltransferase involved in cell wall biosynthesis
LPELPTGRERRPKVSVAVITFNHASFITQALEGVVNQKTNFDWEIVIGDDYSTDGTREILTSYAARHPERIRLLLHPRQLGPDRPGLQGKNNLLATYRACRGEYVALLEGDDYWTDEHKLEKQVSFLEAHPNCSLCSHAVAVEYSGGRGQHWGPMIGESSETIFSAEDFLRQKTEISTPSMLFRRRSLGEIPAWFAEEVNGDYALQALLAGRGDVGVLPEFMAVHRKHNSGLSRLYDTNPDFYTAAFMDLLVTLNKHFDYRFRSILDPQIKNLQAAVAATAVRSLAWSPDRTETPIRLSVDQFVPHLGRLDPGLDGRTSIVTHPTAWAYAATLPLPTKKAANDNDRPAYASIWARAEGATIGIGVLHRRGVLHRHGIPLRDGDHFIDRCSLEPSEVGAEVRLGIPRVRDAGDLVVQTWDRAESATVHIEKVELVVFAESSMAAHLSRRGR